MPLADATHNALQPIHTARRLPARQHVPGNKLPILLQPCTAAAIYCSQLHASQPNQQLPLCLYRPPNPAVASAAAQAPAPWEQCTPANPTNARTRSLQNRESHRPPKAPQLPQLPLPCLTFLSMSVAMLKMPCVGWSQAAHLPVLVLCLHTWAGERRPSRQHCYVRL